MDLEAAETTRGKFKTVLFEKRLFFLFAAWGLLFRTDKFHKPFRQRDNLLYDMDASHYDPGVPSGPLDWICSQKPLHYKRIIIRCHICTEY